MMKKVMNMVRPNKVRNNFLNDNVRKSIVKHIDDNSNIFSNLGNVENVGYGNFKISHFKNDKFKFKEGDYIVDYFTNNIPECKNFKQDIQNIIDKTSIELGFTNLKVDNSWITIMDKESSLMRHDHIPSKLSGVIYLNIDESSSDIYFYNPNDKIKLYQFDKADKNNCRNFYFKPKNNDLIIFPSWIEHDSSYKVNQSTNRIALSFNSL
jgi:uncharacterized protein (TIGR02466 family)